jgi:acetate kinase
VLAGVGHRVVHGGPDYAAPLLVTPEAMRRLEDFIPLAPLHQPHNLAAIRAVQEVQPDLPQVACFDTAFHQTQERVAQFYGLPYEYFERGVRRYGFHGLSYEYIAGALPIVAPAIAGGRVVVAHLGSGASMCAMRDGRSVGSSMGFTALDGLLMGTRPGNMDPGIVLYLLQQEGMSAKQIEDLLYKRSGAARPVGDRQRHAGSAGERGSAGQAGDRAFRLPHRSRTRRARRRPRRPRRAGVHCRHRREQWPHS